MWKPNYASVIYTANAVFIKSRINTVNPCHTFRHKSRPIIHDNVMRRKIQKLHINILS